MPEEFLVIVVKLVVILLVLITAVAYIQFAGRRVQAFMQSRLSPNRTDRSDCCNRSPTS
jgi:NADH:ubiquinone oxidoreductase subunit H